MCLILANFSLLTYLVMFREISSLAIFTTIRFKNKLFELFCYYSYQFLNFYLLKIEYKLYYFSFL